MRYVALLLIVLGNAAYAQSIGGGSGIALNKSSGGSVQQFNTTVFNCSSGFATSGSCGIDISGGGNTKAFYASSSSPANSLSGSTVILIPTGVNHNGISMIYQTQVNVQAFQTTFQFVPNGQNVALVLQNVNNQSSTNGNVFASGAGCEAGWFQGVTGGGPPPNNLFALEFDSYSPLTEMGSFTYSNVQWYWGQNASNAPLPPGQNPCNPSSGNEDAVPFTYHSVTKISTSPVPLNSPSSSQNTTTGDTYSATMTYSSSTQVLTLDMYDVTAGGTCTPVTSGTCFHNTWSSVDIPTAVGSNTAWAGLIGAAGLSSSFPLDVLGWLYKTP